MDLVKNEEFDQFIKQYDVSIAYFYNNWCPSCKMLKFVLEELTELYPSIGIINICTSDFHELTSRYNVTYIPTMLFFRNGIKYYEHEGFIEIQELTEIINK